MKFNRIEKQIVEFIKKYPIEEGIYEITRKDFEKEFEKNINYENNLNTLIANEIIVSCFCWRTDPKIIRHFFEPISYLLSKRNFI